MIAAAADVDVVVVVVAVAVAGTLGRDRKLGTAQVAHGHIFAGRRREKTWRRMVVARQR
jgi:hypothetical protein